MSSEQAEEIIRLLSEQNTKIQELNRDINRELREIKITMHKIAK